MSNLTVEEIAQRLMRPRQCAVCETRSAELFLCLTCYKIVCREHGEHEVHSVEPCECDTVWESRKDRYKVVYCNTHKAAHQMLRALEAVRRGQLSHHSGGDPGMIFDSSDAETELKRSGWYAVDEAAIREVQEALVAARGFDSQGGASQDDV